jgi:hypothetical protein
MCVKCFSHEIYAFESQSEFEMLINIITNNKELLLTGSNPGGLGKPKFEIFGIGFGGTVDYGFDIYICKVCNTHWKLSEPDNAWRGYFKYASKEDVISVSKTKI